MKHFSTNLAVLSIFCAGMFFPGAVDARHQTIPEKNFKYLGAFRVPESFRSGGHSLAFRPGNGRGSLFLVTGGKQVAEISIPRPKKPRSKTQQGLQKLPRATLIQKPGGITGKQLKSINEGGGTVLGGIGYVTNGTNKPKLYWTAYRYYNVTGEDLPGHGFSEIDLQNPEPQGPWHLGPANDKTGIFHSKKTAGYLFDIPRKFADKYLGGKFLASGLTGVAGQALTSAGPSLFAFAPWHNTENAEPEAIPLLFYNLGKNEVKEHTKADKWYGGAWLTAGKKQAVLFAGTKSLGEVYYGNPKNNKTCSPYKGYHGDPYEGQFLLYDPLEFRRVLQGKKKPSQVQPYARFSPKELFPTCDRSITGVAFDRENSRLYVLQPEVETEGHRYEPLAVIHVYSIRET